MNKDEAFRLLLKAGDAMRTKLVSAYSGLAGSYAIDWDAAKQELFNAAGEDRSPSYMVVYSDNIKDLEEHVERKLYHGWKLVGGLSVSHTHQDDGRVEAAYWQAMYKENR